MSAAPLAIACVVLLVTGCYSTPDSSGSAGTEEGSTGSSEGSAASTAPPVDTGSMDDDGPADSSGAMPPATADGETTMGAAADSSGTDGGSTCAEGACSGSSESGASTGDPAGVCDMGECGDCQACAFAQDGPCEAEGTACFTDPECIALNDCFGTCPDQACIDQCGVDHPGGVDLYNAAIMCLTDLCPMSCG